MNYNGICMQVSYRIGELEKLGDEYDIVVYVGRNEWNELKSNYFNLDDKPLEKEDAQLFGRKLVYVDADDYLGVGIEAYS